MFDRQICNQICFREGVSVGGYGLIKRDILSVMKKVFIVHGFQGTPDGGWRPWLVKELTKQNISSEALAMPRADNPVCSEWVDEISKHLKINKNNEIYLVGHSLGTTAILRYLESGEAECVYGAVLVSGPSESNGNTKIESFLNKGFDFENIKEKCKKFVIIHGDDDPVVSFSNAETLSRELGGELVVVKKGGHLNGSAGWIKLPQCLDALNGMMEK